MDAKERGHRELIEAIAAFHRAQYIAGPGTDKCERCRRHVQDVGIHNYWPTWKICPRCVQVLLEIKAPPFILRPGTADDYYTCKDELEWHRIMTGEVPLP